MGIEMNSVQNQDRPRSCLYDNWKAVLMFLVVFGHFLEEIRYEDELCLLFYNYIYLFHMPAFIFCSGVFAKFDWKKIVKRYLIPYIVFQILFGLFDIFVMKSGRAFTMLNSYYVLWYLLSMAGWTIMLLLCRTENRRKQILYLAASIAVSLAAGYVDFIGKELSLSRTIVFFPFFLAGSYYGKRAQEWKERLQKESPKKQRILQFSAIAAFLLSFSALYFVNGSINTWALFEYTSYRVQGYHALFRLLHLTAAAILSAAMFLLIGNKKNRFTYFGARTLPIYIGHVLIVYIGIKLGVLTVLDNTAIRLLYAFTAAASAMFVLAHVSLRPS